MTTVFHEIVAGKLPAEKVFENDRILAFKDINPLADVHILIIPKKAYRNLQEVPKEDIHVIAEIASKAQDLAEEFGITDGYRFLTNNGPQSGQEVDYLHFHVIGGGRRLGPMA